MTVAGNPNGYPTKDWTNRAGAETLAENIRAYWAARGRKVETVVFQYSEKVYGVRSNIPVLLPVGSPT